MKNYLKTTYIFFGYLLCTAVVVAQDNDDVRQCATIKDDLARLACYDQTMTDVPLPKNESVQPPVAAEAKAGPMEAPPPTVLDVPSKATGSSQAAISADESRNQPAAISESNSPVTSDTAKSSPAGEIHQVTTESDEVVAIVTDVTRRARGQHVVTLDNGQIWTEDFASRYFPVAAGDTVTLKRRSISGYRLITQSGRGYSVERIK